MQENPVPEDADPIGFKDPLPPVPEYAPYVDPIEKSEAFEQLDAMMKERICFIDGAMGTSIQAYKLEEEDYRGERYRVRCCLLVSVLLFVTLLQRKLEEDDYRSECDRVRCRPLLSVLLAS